MSRKIAPAPPAYVPNSKSPELREFLLSTPWVEVLPESIKNRVIDDCQEQIVDAKQSVARKGEASTYFFGVIEGLLKVSTVTARGQSLMFMAVPPNAWIGEGSVIKREPRRYDVVALRQSRVVHVPRATFMWLLETSLEFNRYVIDALNERTGQFLGMLEVSRITDPTGRVGGALCNLFNPVLYPKLGSLIHISQEELGELAGLSRTTVNAAITNLRRLELVHTEYGGLVVLDLERLKSFVYSAEYD